MAEREVKQWITVNGQHVPIMEGQSKAAAVKAAIAKQTNADADKKDKQIAANERQANEKNDKYVTREQFDAEAKKQGIKLTSDDIDEYVASSYGANALGDKISKFIDDAPDSMKIGDAAIYRGLSFNSKTELDAFINSHKEGAILESRRDGLSWTTDKNVAKDFSSNASKYSVTLVNEDDAKNAIPIKNISDTPSSSSEVLYSSSTDFEVMEVEREGNQIIMYVTEAPVSKQKYK